MCILSHRITSCLIAILYLVPPCGQGVQAQALEKPTPVKDAAVTAASLAKAIEQARTRFFADFGPNAFDQGIFPGDRTVGTVWEGYLDQAGYPHSQQERLRAAELLGSAGLDQSAAFVLVSGRANDDAVRYLLRALKRIASGPVREALPVADPDGVTFLVRFDDEMPPEAELTTKDNMIYRPRRDDKLSWKFSCDTGDFSAFENTKLATCDDKAYGYLVANSAKTPLTSRQGSFVYIGTRSTGEDMRYEAPSGRCRPILSSLAENKCTLEVTVARTTQ